MSLVDYLEKIGGQVDGLDVNSLGKLTLCGCSVDTLVEAHGTPLFTTLETVIRENITRFRAAFEKKWPTGVEIFYAIKTNNNLAIRSIMNTENVGGECFGEVEFRATLESGLSGACIILNGSDKTETLLASAVAKGSTINIDSMDELDTLERLAKPQLPTRVNIRLRLAPKTFDRFDASFFKSSGTVSDILTASKWGFSTPQVIALVRRIMTNESIRLLGFSAHVGRFSNDPKAFGAGATEMARIVTEVHAETDFWPEVLDLGGGWPRRREPESRDPALNPHDIFTYAQAVTGALRSGLKGPLPRLWLEPGRYLVGNAVVLLTSATSLRMDLERRWIHVDASTNLLMRIETSKSWYHILPASQMRAPSAGLADIVGPTCVPSVLGTDREMPVLQRDDIIAILDAGMYAEVLASQFNGMPRPAGILISPEGGFDEIRRRETYADIFRTHCLPPRLVAANIARFL
jgi:diaminopimelate decarboxylase